MKRRDREWVRALVDGELDATTAEALRARARQQPELAAYIARMEGLRSNLATLRGVSVSPRPFVAPQKNAEKSGRWLWLMGPLAAVGAAAAVFVLKPAGQGGPDAGAAQGEPAGVEVRLSFAAPQASEVRVAGDFNGWQPEPLAREGDRWATHLRLPPGRYAYMYVVDGQWTADPEAHSFRDDEFGRKNAVLHL